jgi:hypothetical protein
MHAVMKLEQLGSEGSRLEVRYVIAPFTCGVGSVAGLVRMKQHTPPRSQLMTTQDLGLKVKKGSRNSMIYV